ncbi:hypothetical protein [Marinactinospora rubrisoli]|uniref:Uncharacterized protein n=1 Tax=Marinactinospora rubrisoli TaxID=2715399 RepID=A0ABW2KLP4_9ACTN
MNPNRHDPIGVPLLADAVALTVPLHIAELRAHVARPDLVRRREEVLTAIAARAGVDFGHSGDQLLFRPESAAGRRGASIGGTALARGIAAACLLNAGGVEALGRHWCAGPHEGCPAARPVDGEPMSWDEAGARITALLDAFEALLDGESSPEAA